MLVVGHDEGHHNPNGLQASANGLAPSPFINPPISCYACCANTKHVMDEEYGHGGLGEESLLCY
jgi:hypothetical protein